MAYITGEEWLAKYCVDNGIDPNKLSKAERFQLSMEIPCTVRCFRVGGYVNPMEVGEKCPECGRVHKEDPYKPKSAWNRLDEPVV